MFHVPARALGQAPVRVAAALGVVAVLAGAAACGGGSATTTQAAGSNPAVAAAVPATGPLRSVPTVAPLRHRVRPDVLVLSQRPLAAKTIRRIDRLSHVVAATPLEVGTVHIHGRAVRIVAADPSRFRRFAPAGTAEANAVWQTLAEGQLVVAHSVAQRLGLALGSPVFVRAGHRATTLRLGALATTIPGADVLVSPRVASWIGMRRATGLVLSTGHRGDPTEVASEIRSVVGSRAHIDLLSPPTANPTAFLTGGAAASAFGAFSYRYFPDGTIEPNSGWVAANIVSESVPILGTITCHRLMFPQLRGALEQVVSDGLAGEIHASEYGGCYVPRFIEHNPQHSISLHTWGIAIDLNVAENGYGTRGSMDPRVVAIFKQWGFDWGGDWSTPDPMHFQIRALLRS